MWNPIYIIGLFLILSPAVAGEIEESPLQVSGVTTIDVAKAKVLFDTGVPFVDVRNDKDWKAGRIPGAVHLEYVTDYSVRALSAILKKDKNVVFYCTGSKCLHSAQAAQKAVEWGFKNVFYFRDGLVAWQGEAFPIE